MRKTRKLYMHEGVNGGKVGALRALDAAYRIFSDVPRTKRLACQLRSSR